MKIALALALMFSGCAKRIEVVAPNHTIVLNDRIHDIVVSQMSDDAKIKAIQFVLDREKDRGANYAGAIREILAWLTAAVAVAK